MNGSTGHNTKASVDGLVWSRQGVFRRNCTGFGMEMETSLAVVLQESRVPSNDIFATICVALLFATLGITILLR